jgi:broad specificity phosphatase PhoE
MTTLIFIRHGETAWSKGKKHTVRGRIDLPLNKIGEEQATVVAEQLSKENISTVYSSPLKRAVKTAEKVAKPHGIKEIEHIGFIDLDFGSWQGRLHKDLVEEFPRMYNKWLARPDKMVFPHGETLQAVYDRVSETLTDLIKKHKNETIVIVSHGVVLKVVLCYINQVGINKFWDFDVDNCTITKVKYKKGKFEIETMNDSKHLSNIS